MSTMFNKIVCGETYSRKELAKLWGYSSFHPLARGVVTPRDTNVIILFVTGEKQASQQQYRDIYINGTLQWEGPTDHFAEERMIDAQESGDEIHLFYRERFNLDFSYKGRLIVKSYELYGNRPSKFIFNPYK